MTKSETSRSPLAIAIVLVGSLFGSAYAAPTPWIPSTANHHGAAPCPQYYIREIGYNHQCAPLYFSRVWHSALNIRPASVTTLTNTASEADCYISILKTGVTFQQFTWSSVTSACTFTVGDTTWTDKIASHPSSDNIIATNLAGTCASQNFATHPLSPGIPCQDVVWQNHQGIPPYNIGQALAYSHIQ